MNRTLQSYAERSAADGIRLLLRVYDGNPDKPVYPPQLSAETQTFLEQQTYFKPLLWKALPMEEQNKILKADKLEPEAREICLSMCELSSDLMRKKILPKVLIDQIAETQREIDDLKKGESLSTDHIFVQENMDLIHLCLKWNYDFADPPESALMKRKNSGEALDMHNTTTSSFDINNKKLKSSDVHYAMFWGFDSQTFHRFSMKGITIDKLFPKADASFRSGLNRIVNDASEELEGMARDGGLTGALESITQLAFQSVFKNMTKDLCQLAMPNKKLTVRSVTNMKSVEFEQKINDRYVKTWKTKNKQKANRLKRSKTGSNTGKKRTTKRKAKDATEEMKTIVVEGDLVLWDENQTLLLEGSKGIGKQEMFLRTPLNCEMKKYERLSNHMNRSELTQLALQAFARAEGRARAAEQFQAHKTEFSKENVVYSMLTDGTLLYVLRHDVQKKEYWVSRSIDSPKEMATVMCWLVLMSQNHPCAASFEKDWECKRLDDTERDLNDICQSDYKVMGDSHTQNADFRIGPPDREEQEEQDNMFYRVSDLIGCYDLKDALTPGNISQQLDREPVPRETLMERFTAGIPVPMGFKKDSRCDDGMDA